MRLWAGGRWLSHASLSPPPSPSCLSPFPQTHAARVRCRGSAYTAGEARGLLPPRLWAAQLCKELLVGQAVCCCVVPTADTQCVLEPGGRQPWGWGRAVSCSQTPFESSASRAGTEGPPPPNLCPTARLPPVPSPQVPSMWCSDPRPRNQLLPLLIQRKSNANCSAL